MAQHVICHECRYVLYDGDAFISPEKIIRQYNCTCPKCGRNLSILPLEIEIRPL
jgi:hypothetical protein